MIVSNKLIKVYSHPRSGTNFLCSALKDNFFQDQNLSTRGQWGHWSNRQTFKSPVLHGKLFGNHTIIKNHPTENSMDRRIYIYRDGRDVAVSLWKTKLFLNLSMGKLSFADFLRTNLDWIYTPASKSLPGQNIVQHWYSHVSVCASSSDKSYEIITFEDLLLNTQKTLDQIAEKFDLTYNGDFENSPALVGPSPNTGIVGKWKEYFTEKDLEYFYRFVPRNSPYIFKGN
tara:strand:+ start:1562 stop:2248 length:687 start_codon:yes stop_codon:yes gene_type:complete